MTPFRAPQAGPGLIPGRPPTISILIAAYQAADTISQAVESALAQTARAHEVIVVDDGSSDATGDVLGAYRDRITYLRQENRGAPAASNLGIRRATGEFVSILDADDFYEPGRLEALGELAAARPDLDILMTDAYLEADDKIVGRFCDRTPFAVSGQNLEIFERCFVAWPAVRRNRLIAAGGFDESLPIGYDWECWIRMLHTGSSAGLVDEPLMRYRIGEHSLTTDRVTALRSRVTLLERAAALDLSADEREALGRFLPGRRRRALLAEAEQALREGSADARRRALELARAPDVGRAVRIKALAAAVAPRTAGRRLDAREARSGHSRVKREPPRG